MSVRPRSSGQARLVGGIVGILGIWGALVPFVGPSFGYGMGGVASWTWSESHLTLHLLPGIAAVLGAWLLIRGGRANQKFGSLIAVLAGAWFVVGPSLHPLWAGNGGSGGSGMHGMNASHGMASSATSDALSAIGYHYGTGVLIAVFAAFALGALSAPVEAAQDIRTETSSADRSGARDSSTLSV